MARRLSVWIALFLSGCGGEGGTGQAPSTTARPHTSTPDAPALPSGAPLEQSPDCLETVVSTACGRTVRCAKTGQDRLVFRDDKRLEPADDPCLRALVDLRAQLRALERSPAQQGYGAEAPHERFPPPDPFDHAASSACSKPSPAEIQRATDSVLAQVKKEGIARLRTFGPAEQAYWTKLLRDRFDFISVRASCKSTTKEGAGAQEAFLLETISDVGAPGSLPYWGLWRVAGRAGLAKLAEVSDPSPVTTWPAGDLDGDGVEELFARVQLPGDAGGARYELIDVAHDQNLVLLARKGEKPEEAALPHPVYSVRLSKQWVIAVEDQTTVYVDHALKEAGSDAIAERRSLEEHLRSEVRRVAASLDATVPSFPGAKGCEDAARVGWTLAVARDLVRIGALPPIGAVARVAPISGLASCLEGTNVIVSP